MNVTKEFVKQNGVLFLSYTTFLSQALIVILTNLIEEETKVSKVSIGDSSNILTIFIELAQNVLNYSKTNELESNECKSEGLITVGKSIIDSQQFYYIACQNIVALADKEKMQPKLEEILKLNKNDLKKRYRELRKSGKNTHNNGGGIGFYEIAKRSDKIEFEFSQINEDKFYFQFTSFVNIKSTE